MKLHLNSEIARNVLAVFLGFVIVALMILIIDKTFGWLMDIKLSKSKFFPQSNDIYGLGWTPGGERELQKNARGYSVAHKQMVNGLPVFDVIYNFDTLYRRNVPGNPANRLNKFIIFFGGSQTFGQGLDDEHTIPAFVQKSTLSHRVYNYAYKGYGPHQMLRKLETKSLQAEIPETEGIAFFQYFTFHVPRVLGTMSYISWAGGGAPYYHMNNKNQLEYGGAFATGRSFKTLLYWVLGKSAIAKYYRVDLPPRLTQHDYDLVCRVLERSRNVFLDQYPDSRFVVIIGMTSAQNDSIVQQCLEPNNLEYVDMRSISKNDTGLQFSHDGHFTAKAAQLIAQELIPVVNE